jgi:murein DD-endopeptidase MepM/ murein hydrolase activator NlpD
MKDRKMRLLLLAGFMILLFFGVAVAALLSGNRAPKLSSLEPHTVITPTPGTEQQDSVIARTAKATPVHLIRTPAPVLPENAVNLLSDGDALFALDSRETAELLLRTYFQQCAYENIDANSILLKATLVSSVTTVPADGSVEYLTFDAALTKLRKNRALISVQRTVERATVTVEPTETVRERTALLPEGAKLYRRVGTPARTLSLSEIFYKDGFAASDTETLNRQINSGSPQSVLIGTYRSAHPEREPDAKEGKAGKSAGKLSFVAPVRGTVTGHFGIRNFVMYYGVDYTAASGARIVAPEDGTVIFCGERPGYGFVIEIRHENGFVSRISSCANVTVELEQHVKRGSIVAYMPQTDNREQPTLHYELLIDGIPYNPLFYLP